MLRQKKVDDIIEISVLIKGVKNEQLEKIKYMKGAQFAVNLVINL